jgi:hypothetical protein
MELQKNITVIAIETIAQSQVLLALNDIDIKNKEATCLSVLLKEGVAYPSDRIDLIANAVTLNSYDFFSPMERKLFMVLFKQYLNKANSRLINALLVPGGAE